MQGKTIGFWIEREEDFNLWATLPYKTKRAIKQKMLTELRAYGSEKEKNQVEEVPPMEEPHAELIPPYEQMPKPSTKHETAHQSETGIPGKNEENEQEISAELKDFFMLPAETPIKEEPRVLPKSGKSRKEMEPGVVLDQRTDRLAEHETVPKSKEIDHKSAVDWLLEHRPEEPKTLSKSKETKERMIPKNALDWILQDRPEQPEDAGSMDLAALGLGTLLLLGALGFAIYKTKPST